MKVKDEDDELDGIREDGAEKNNTVGAVGLIIIFCSVLELY